MIRGRVPWTLAGGSPLLMVHEEMEDDGLLAGNQEGGIMSEGNCRLPEDAWV